MNWLEKYRPESLDDIVGQDHIVKRLKSLVRRVHEGKEDIPPDIGLFGPEGCGKTAIAIALAKDLWGKSWKNNTLELNTSDERGINVVRERIKEYAEKPPMGFYEYDGEDRRVEFSIVFLDESDSMTPDAQAAMRRTMEKCERTVFILTGNYGHKIIEPIQDRMLFASSKVPCKRIPAVELLSLIDRVVDGEGLDIDEEVKNWISERSNGSARKAILTLYMLNLKDGKITMNDTKNIKSHQEVSDNFNLNLYSAIKHSGKDEIKKMMNDIDSLYYDMGLSGQQILYGVFENNEKLCHEGDVLEDDYLELLSSLANGMDMINRSANDIIMLKAFLGKLCAEE